MNNYTHPPALTEKAFDCPHCGVFAKQSWFYLSAEELRSDAHTPISHINAAKQILSSLTNNKENIEWAKNIESGRIFFDLNHSSKSQNFDVYNLYISECFNCVQISVWVNQTLVFPVERFGDAPNPDLPWEIIKDIEEARSILRYSPRSASALLRICVNKLCLVLGGTGESIDQDIAVLVSKGLNPLVKSSLEIMRVTGSDAILPSHIDAHDDISTALGLLRVVNIIADYMITMPKSIMKMNDELPKTLAIELQSKDRQ